MSCPAELRDPGSDLADLRLPTTLVPYDVAREVSLTAADLAAMTAEGGAAAWVAARAAGWLDYWRDEIGRSGFYPFDLLAAVYVLHSHLFDCARSGAWVSRDRKLWGWLYDPKALLVGLERERPPGAEAGGRVVYCARIEPGWRRRAMARLAPSSLTLQVRTGP